MDDQSPMPAGLAVEGAEDDAGLSVNLAPDLRAMVERLAKQEKLTAGEVIVRALLNQQFIVEQKTQGRLFQIKDKKAGVASVEFI